ncbi:uncharacterized protein LOC114075642 [Solanum pennellii]|uniref:Uncharacterized protein LOC114075642 n=1 Tax=Solanum pennellii TaxID=28526 RepID=A0ABM1V2C5_SOLPN|nr:uncharacterized protein LOC114075642 [Solanum pennellii]
MYFSYNVITFIIQIFLLQHKFRNIVFSEELLNLMDEIILNQSSSHHDSENSRSSENRAVDSEHKVQKLRADIAEVKAELKELKITVHNHMTDIKMHVDNSTKMIIDEIRLSRGEQIPEEQPEFGSSCFSFWTRRHQFRSEIELGISHVLSHGIGSTGME